MASIIRRGNKYAIAVYLGRIDGKKRYQWLSGFRTMKEAKARKHEIESSQDKGIFIQPGKLTVSQYLEHWLKDYVKPNLAPRTAEGYEFIVYRHIIPVLGKILLTQLRPGDIQKFYSDKLVAGRIDGKGGLAGKTVHSFHVLLHDAFEVAIKQGLLIRNPCDAVTAPHCKKPEMHVLDEDGISRVLEALKKTDYYSFFYLLLFTGLRRSEALALRWKDIDLTLAELSVSRAMHHLRTGEYIFMQPKTARSRRLVSLTPSTCVVLREHYEKQKAQHLLSGVALLADTLVFCHPDNTPLCPETVTLFWIRLVNRLGLKGIRLHDLRHTHASLLLKQNVHPKIVQERLGHSSIAITLDMYSHMAPGMQQAAAEGFDEAVNKSRSD